MTPQPDFRRYLVNINTITTNQLFTDCLVIGAGIAGLRAAIEAAKTANVIIVCKSSLEDSNTWKAQGGIASVIKKNDSFESHIKDTFNAGCDLNDKPTVELVIRQAPELINELIDWHTDLDKENNEIASSLEAGQSYPRVVHGHGDETGRIIAQALIKKVQTEPNIKIISDFYAIDLITNDNNDCIGIIAQDQQQKPQIIWAQNTILATGGAGQLYRETTNPPQATGDGIAMAYRAGAVLQDLEFMQFHPTTLYIAGASRALVTEALRGEGAILLDCNHKPFMKAYDPAAELAPRDIVSRAILSQMLKTDSTHVYLDARHFSHDAFKKRFPFIYELCRSFDIDTSKDLIPVRPSAHYMVGGVKTDLQAKTNIPHLYAAGEVAATGLHGANRLASNSLLEGLVFGKIAGKNAADESASDIQTLRHPRITYTVPNSDRTRLDTADVKNSLRALMWRNVGITRKEKPLKEAQEIIRFWQRYVMDKVFETPNGYQCQNMLTTALLIAHAAEQRKESRGVHYRSDHPTPNNNACKTHQTTKKDD
jgi:L-aspartate oxidase